MPNIRLEGRIYRIESEIDVYDTYITPFAYTASNINDLFDTGIKIPERDGVLFVAGHDNTNRSFSFALPVSFLTAITAAAHPVHAAATTTGTTTTNANSREFSCSQDREIFLGRTTSNNIAIGGHTASQKYIIYFSTYAFSLEEVLHV